MRFWAAAWAEGGHPPHARRSWNPNAERNGVSSVRMGKDAQTPGGNEGPEPGLGQPRWRRYHPPYLLSAPEIYDPQAVAWALAILKSQEGVRERRHEPRERPERRSDRSALETDSEQRRPVRMGCSRLVAPLAGPARC
jgi:hypothetical protein